MLDEGARALDPVKLVTLLRDGTDACQPLTWLTPSGHRPDRRAARAAHVRRGRVRAEDARRAAGLGDLRRRSAAAVAKAAGSTEARAEQAIRAGLATRRRRAPEGQRAAVDRRRRDAGRCPAWCRPTACCSPCRAPTTPARRSPGSPPTASRRWPRELVLYGVMGAACEPGLSVLAVAEALTGDAPPAALEEPLRQGLLAGVDAAEKAGAIGTIRAFALRAGDRQRADLRRDRDHPRPAVDDPHGAERRARRRRRATAARKSTTLDQRRAGAIEPTYGSVSSISAAAMARPRSSSGVRRWRCVNHATMAPARQAPNSVEAASTRERGREANSSHPGGAGAGRGAHRDDLAAGRDQPRDRQAGHDRAGAVAGGQHPEERAVAGRGRR